MISTDVSFVNIAEQLKVTDRFIHEFHWRKDFCKRVGAVVREYPEQNLWLGEAGKLLDDAHDHLAVATLTEFSDIVAISNSKKALEIRLDSLKASAAVTACLGNL